MLQYALLLVGAESALKVKSKKLLPASSYVSWVFHAQNLQSRSIFGGYCLISSPLLALKKGFPCNACTNVNTASNPYKIEKAMVAFMFLNR